MTEFPIFDVHTHVWPDHIAPLAVRSLSDFYDLDIEGEGTLPDMLQNAADGGIKGALLFSVATTAHQVEHVNDGIALAVKRAREAGLLCAGFAGMHQDHPDPVRELLRATELGLCGVKLHPDIQGVNIDDPRLFALYAAMQERDLPLCLHMGDAREAMRFSSVERLLAMHARFPALRVIAAHLGGYFAWDGVAALADEPNIFFDTSSTLWAIPNEKATAIIRRFGTDRVMFGTDYPVRRARDEVARFFALTDFTKEEQRAMLYDNAIRFLGL